MASSGFKAAGLSGLMGQTLDLKDAVPQSQPLDARQVQNNAGGFTFQVDDMAKLRRFLIIGSEGGTYYVTEQKLTLDAARCIRDLLEGGKGAAVVSEIVRVSSQGRAPKQAPGVFALALCCRLGDTATKRAAFDALPAVCRTASTLFDFVAYCKAINQEVAEAEGRKVCNASWGRAMRHAVAGWYLSKTPRALAYQVTKYVQRGGWSNRDLLRLAHPQPSFVRVAAQRQQAAAAAGQLERASLASPAAEDEEDWQMVPGGAAEAAGGAAETHAADAAAAAGSAAALDQKVAEMQRVFRFIVDEEAPPAAEGDGPIAAYLAAAHRLKKAQLATIPEEAGGAAAPGGDVAAGEPAAAGGAGAAAAEARDAAGGAAGAGATSTEAAAEAAPAATAAQAPAAAEAAAAAAAGSAATASAVPDAIGAAAADSPAAAAAAADAQLAKKRRVERKPKLPVPPIGEAEACDLIRCHRFSREHVGDTRLLKRIPVWEALLDVGMPFAALTRNLGRLTSLGLFDAEKCPRAAEHLAAVTARFADPDAMKASRAHPIVLLNALRVYAAGRGDQGSLTWEPHPEIKRALDKGFYNAFRNVEPTGRRFLLGVDVSGSMDYYKCVGMSALTPRDAAVAVAMCLLRTEGEGSVTSMAFASTFHPLRLAASDSLEAATAKARAFDFGGTDCAQPMLYALEKGLKVDCFVVLTDNETWAGQIHPSEALKQYRAKTGIPARLLVLAFSGASHTVADPDDAGMLDVPGLDAGVPEVMRQFVLGEL